MKMERRLRENKVWRDVTILYKEMLSAKTNYTSLMIIFCEKGLSEEETIAMSKMRSVFLKTYRVLKEFHKVLEVMRRYGKNTPLTNDAIDQSLDEISKMSDEPTLQRMELKARILNNALSLLNPITLKFNTEGRLITTKEIKHPSIITDNEEFIKKVLFDVDLTLLDSLYLPIEINPDQEGDVFYKFRRNEKASNCFLVSENDSPVLKTKRDIRAGEELTRFISSDNLLERYNIRPTKEKKTSLEDYINNPRNFSSARRAAALCGSPSAPTVNFSITAMARGSPSVPMASMALIRTGRFLWSS
jgi:hypothetical protein